MRVIINNQQEKEINIDGEITINELLKKLNLNRESVVVIVNGEIKVEEEKVKNSDEVKIISAISGGGQ